MSNHAAQKVEIIHTREFYGFGIRLDNLEQVFIPSHIVADVQEGETIFCTISTNYKDKTGRTPWFAAQRVWAAETEPQPAPEPEPEAKMVPVVDYTAPTFTELVTESVDDMPLFFTSAELAERMNTTAKQVGPRLEKMWKSGELPFRLVAQRGDTSKASFVIWCRSESRTQEVMRNVELR